MTLPHPNNDISIAARKNQDPTKEANKLGQEQKIDYLGQAHHLHTSDQQK